MTLLTIQETAKFLRLTKRTLYQRLDIPRVRYGHRVMFVKEDLENWIRGHREGPSANFMTDQELSRAPVDPTPTNVYHRNRLFMSGRQR